MAMVADPACSVLLIKFTISPSTKTLPLNQAKTYRFRKNCLPFAPNVFLLVGPLVLITTGNDLNGIGPSTIDLELRVPVLKYKLYWLIRFIYPSLKAKSWTL